MGRSKKVFIPIIIGLIIITCCIVFLLVFMGKKSNNNPAPVTESATPTNEVVKPSEKPEEEEIDLSNVDKKYSDVILSFAKGLSSTKGMESFLKDYLDPAAFVAFTQARGKTDKFFEEYEKVTEEAASEIEEKFKEMISKNDTFTVVKITDIEEIDENDDSFTTCDFTLRNSDGKEAVFTIVFFRNDDDEIVISITDKADTAITEHSKDFADYFEEVKKKESKDKSEEKSTGDSNIEDALSKMSQQEKDIYNAKIKPFIGEAIKGSEVKAMIDAIISLNQQNIGESGKFIGIIIPAGKVTNYSDNEELLEACDKASIYSSENGSDIENGDNTEETVEEATTKMTALKAKINSQKNYTVTAKMYQGTYTWISIEEAEAE